MSEINIKTQTSRTTKMLNGFNCVNLFLKGFEVGLETRNWGEKKEDIHKIAFSIDGEDYVMPLDEFKKRIIPILKRWRDE